MVDNWLAAAEGDGLIERTVHISKHEEVAQGSSLLQTNIKRKFFDDHIWLSIGYRQLRSKFTRVQRLCTCLAILFLMMVSNAMWYGTGDSSGNQAAIVIGPVRVSVIQLYTSIMSSLIVVPPTLIITMLFSRARPRPVKTQGGRKQETQAVGASERADTQKTKGFPWWTIYFAYMLLVASVAASAFFTILYALQWGKQKSETWLFTFVLGFAESVFVIEPFNVSGCSLSSSFSPLR